MRISTVCLLAVTLLTQSTTLIKAAHPLVHLQTDRPTYRLGETIWYRVHTEFGHTEFGHTEFGHTEFGHAEFGEEQFREKARREMLVRLLGPAGQVLDSASFQVTKANASDAIAGSFSISEEFNGGSFFLQARLDGVIAHEIPIDVYDLDLPQLDLSLEILGENHYPGETVRASFSARDLNGKPIAKTRVEYLATFGKVRIRDTAGVTDADGRVMIRFELPEETIESGFLSVGVNSRRKQAAIARAVRVSSSVARIDMFPEGGTLIEGHPYRVALLVRDLDGVPTAAAGRIVDQAGNTVGSFRSDSRGLATAVVPGEKGEAYDAVVDRPSRVSQTFPMPEPTSHDVSVFVEPMEKNLRVEVRGTEKMAGTTCQVFLSTATSSSVSRTVTLTRPDRTSLPQGQTSIPKVGKEGVGYIVVRREDRALIKRPVFFGTPEPLQVEFHPYGSGLPTVGRDQQFIVVTKRGDERVAADLAISMHREGAAQLASLGLRKTLEPVLPRGVFAPASFLSETEYGYDGRDAFLLVYNSYSYPREGVELEADGLPPTQAGRGALDVVAPRAGTRQESLAYARRIDLSDEVPAPKPEADGKGKTVVRATGFERLLERAHFTRSTRPREIEHTVDLNASPKKLLAALKATPKQDVLPQKQTVASSKIDARRTLFWGHRVRTSKFGEAILKIRLSDLVGDVSWVVEGRAGDQVASKTGTIKTSWGFKTDVSTPKHLHVGDTFDLMISNVVTDTNKKPLDIRVEVPSCLRALTPTKFRFDPRVDPRLRRLRFEVVKPTQDAKLLVLSDRGTYREKHARRIVALPRTIKQSIGKAGRTAATEVFSTKVPADALEGSVRVFGNITPGYVAQLRDWYRSRLVEPQGCFEQFTGRNISNLLTLEALLEHDRDPALIEEAYSYARKGYDRIVSYCDPDTGGLRLFPKEKPTTYCTLVGLRHLALYAKLFDGLGRPELERGLYWLEQQGDLDIEKAVHLTSSLNDIGRSWKGARKACFANVKTPYLLALQAYALANWPERALKRETKDEAAERHEHLRKRLAKLEQILALRGEKKISWGRDMHLSGEGSVAVSVLALTALAYDAAGQNQKAVEMIEGLTDDYYRQGKHMAGSFPLLAFTRLTEPTGNSRVRVKFASSLASTKAITTLPGSTRSVEYSKKVKAKPGQTVDVSVEVLGKQPLDYRVGFSYLSARPETSPTAPYKLTTHITPVVNMRNDATIRASITPRKRQTPTESQVIARIGLPGGCVIDGASLREVQKKLIGRGHCEVKDGYLDVYYTKGPKTAHSFELKVRAEIAGNFRAQPSFVYPYYESGRTFYSSPLALKVVNTFENNVDEPSARVGEQLRRR